MVTTTIVLCIQTTWKSTSHTTVEERPKPYFWFYQNKIHFFAWIAHIDDIIMIFVLLYLLYYLLRVDVSPSYYVIFVWMGQILLACCGTTFSILRVFLFYFQSSSHVATADTIKQILTCTTSIFTLDWSLFNIGCLSSAFIMTVNPDSYRLDATYKINIVLINLI